MKIHTDINFLKVKEKYPHVSRSIEMFWGYPELVSYIKKILLDSRDGARKGFDYDVLIALTTLLETHHVEFPQHKPPEPPLFTF